MKKALTIGLVAAALAATLPFVFADSTTETIARPLERAAAPIYAIVAQKTATVPSYDRGPRIIQCAAAW